MSEFDWGRVVPESHKLDRRIEAYNAGKTDRQKKEKIASDPTLSRLNKALENAKGLMTYTSLESSQREKGVDVLLASLRPLEQEGTVKINNINLTDGSLNVEIDFIGPDGFQETAKLRSVVDDMVKSDLGNDLRKVPLHQLDEMYKGMGYKARQEFIRSMEGQMSAAEAGEDPAEANQAGMYQLTVFANNESHSVYVYDAYTAQEALQTIVQNAQKGALRVDNSRKLN